MTPVGEANEGLPMIGKKSIDPASKAKYIRAQMIFIAIFHN
jgi:hypothetical protein